jgi:plasmid segregation protein ParM
MYIGGVDVGRSNVKVYHSKGYFSFSSKLGESRDFEFSDEQGKDDIFGEYQGRKFTAGTLVRESNFGTSLMTANKIHEDTVILTLIALHKTFESDDIGLVTNLPINTHSRDKSRLKGMLEGYHEIMINGVKKQFNIRCEVAPEGSGIFKYAGKGIIHGLNIGSRTINAITFEDGMKIGRLSDTFDFGMETQKSNSIQGMAREIAARIGQMKWKEDEPIYLCGGGASSISTELMRYYSKIRLTTNPIFTDAEAFYMIAREVFNG